MARNNRHNTAFVVGSVLGAVAGAAAALWKTPYSGDELRAKLTGGGGAEATLSTGDTAVPTPVTEQRSLKDKVISGVEKTLAPMVGVELGKTANGSGPMSPDIKVNREFVDTGTTRNVASVSRAEDGSQKIGLSQDRVDADKWAAAYAGMDLDGSTGSGTTSSTASSTATTRVTPEAPASSPNVSTPATPLVEDTSSGQGTLLRHPHAWHGYGSSDTSSGAGGGTSVTHAADGSETIGLSQDRVDAEKWAAAYAGTDLDAKETPASPQTAPAASSDTRPANDRERDYASNAEESAAQTGLGAAPAYPGRDSGEIGHPPADREAPDSSVADVAQGAGERAGRNNQASTDDEARFDMEAASIDQLTTPQTNVLPDSQVITEHGMHPFPKLGGKEGAS